MKLTDIFNKKSGPDEARLNLARWYNEVEKFDYMEFNKVLDTFSNHSTTIINYFEERLTNASAESFNAKIKAFRSQLRGVADGNSSCSDWLGYTLKRKLTNQENPLTHYNGITKECDEGFYDMYDNKKGSLSANLCALRLGLEPRTL